MSDQPRLPGEVILALFAMFCVAALDAEMKEATEQRQIAVANQNPSPLRRAYAWGEDVFWRDRAA